MRVSTRRSAVLLLGVLALSFASTAFALDRPPRRARVVRGPRGRVYVNVHRRPGYWRGVRVGARIAVLPLGHRRIVVRGAPYFYYEGAYYRPEGKSYVVVAPPVGAVVEAVPAGCVAVKSGNVVYHHCAGTFYSPATGGFVVVETPIGVTVDELPIGCEEIEDVGGVEHYACSGVLYRPVVRGADTVYVTVRR